MKKFILITLGYICIVLGGIGIFIPILPTTPFILLAGACFASSSEKLYNKLANTKYFGSFIKNYKEKLGIEKKIKVQSLIFLWVVLIISAVVFRKPLVWIILSVVAVGVSLHILCIKTKNSEKTKKTKAVEASICQECGSPIESEHSILCKKCDPLQNEDKL